MSEKPHTDDATTGTGSDGSTGTGRTIPNPIPMDWFVPDPDHPGICWYRGPIPFEELPFPDPDQAHEADYQWASTDPEVRRRYGWQVVVVKNRVVWGAGGTHDAAYEDARRKSGCPTDRELVCVEVVGYDASDSIPETPGRA